MTPLKRPVDLLIFHYDIIKFSVHRKGMHASKLRPTYTVLRIAIPPETWENLNDSPHKILITPLS